MTEWHVSIYVTTYQMCSGICLHSSSPGDILCVGRMAVFARLPLNTADPQTGRTPPHAESAPKDGDNHQKEIHRRHELISSDYTHA